MSKFSNDNTVDEDENRYFYDKIQHYSSNYYCILTQRWPSGKKKRPPREREVVGSITGRDRTKSLKLMAFPLGAQNCWNNTTTGSPVSG